MTNLLTKPQIRAHLENSLNLAEQALADGSYPIGCVVVDENNQVVSAQMNEFSAGDVTSHAEILALRQLGNAADKHSTGSLYLFTSLEPCFGCSFFLARSNVKKIYSACLDPHKGGISQLKSQSQFNDFFTEIELINEPFADLKDKSKQLMHQYFESINNKKAAQFYQP
jgi:tRNA(adenine34) deaminase